MKRYQKFFGPIILGLCAWAAGLRYCAVTEECAKPWREVVEIRRHAAIATVTAASQSPMPVSNLHEQPLYWLIVFGCLALAKIGRGLMTFKDCSEDAKSLDQDIQAARSDLAKRGFEFS